MNPLCLKHHRYHHPNLSRLEYRHHRCRFHHSVLDYQVVAVVDFQIVGLVVLVGRFEFVLVVARSGCFGLLALGLVARIVVHLAVHLVAVGLDRCLVAGLVVQFAQIVQFVLVGLFADLAVPVGLAVLAVRLDLDLDLDLDLVIVLGLALDLALGLDLVLVLDPDLDPDPDPDLGLVLGLVIVLVLDLGPALVLGLAPVLALGLGLGLGLGLDLDLRLVLGLQIRRRLLFHHLLNQHLIQ